MKYSKIDIRNTVRNLIDYFKMQNEVPSQKEIVEVWSKIKEGVEKKKQRRKERGGDSSTQIFDRVHRKACGISDREACRSLSGLVVTRTGNDYSDLGRSN